MADTIQLNIQGNPGIQKIPWTSGMNVQNVLEAAYDTFINPPNLPTLFYWIQYYGVDLGYMVTMIDGTAQIGNKYWMLYINGVLATTGIDSTIVNDGDNVQFNYQDYSPDKHAGSAVAKLHQLIK